MSNNSLYRQIVKGTAIFGGSSMLTMLANIVKGKFTAMFLGNFGMGISSLLASALSPMQTLFSFGLPTAGVKSIAAENDDAERAHAVVAFRRVSYALACAGMFAMMIFSPFLSRFTFGDDTRMMWFVWMSFALLFFILAATENTILQGHRQIKALATCNVAGAICGVLFSVPLYYIYGIQGIVPSMIIVSFTMFLCARFFSRRIILMPVKQSWGMTLIRGRSMLALGGAMMLAGLLGALCTYMINTFIRSHGTIADIGLYQAANVITLQCTSMVFAAMATDYYPHLSSVASQQDEMNRLVDFEGEIVMLIISSVTALLILFSPVIVRVLLTPEFDPVVPLIRLIALGFLARAFCFPIDYVCLARGDKSFFFWVDGVWTNIKTFVLCVSGYYLFGLIGLGYALVLNGLIDILVSAILNKWRYGIRYSLRVLKLYLPLLLLNVLIYLTSYIPDVVCEYVLMTVLTLATCVYAYILLDRRIDIVGLIKQRTKCKK